MWRSSNFIAACANLCSSSVTAAGPPNQNSASVIIATIPEPASNSVPMHDAAWYKNFARSVAIFTSLILSLVYCGARIGFPTNYTGVLRVAGLTLLILNVVPYGGKRWFTHATALILYTLAGVATASWFLARFAAVGWLWAAGGCLLFAWNLITWVSSFKQKRWAILL